MTNASSTTAAAIAPATVVAPLRSRGYWATVWLRLRRDKVSMGCAGLLLGLMLMALLAPWLAPHDPAQGEIGRASCRERV